MAKKHIVFILNKLTGNKRFAQYILDFLEKKYNFDKTFIFITKEDIANARKLYKNMFITKSIALLTRQIIKRKLKEYMPMERKTDGFFVLSFQPLLALGGKYRNIPKACMIDATSTSMLRMCNDWKKFSLIQGITSSIYKYYFKNIVIFLPQCKWAAKSLIYDFKVPM